MTIAACYPCLEGVVLGADSTTTIGGDSYYNYCQKVFEFGDIGSTIGIVMWGLGSLPAVSYRTLISEVSDEAKRQNLPTLGDVACLLSETFWVEYTAAFEQQLIRARALHRKGNACTQEENREHNIIFQGLSCGFCIAGRYGNNKRPKAYQILFDPLRTGTPAPQELQIGQPIFWGCENLINRLIWGIDTGTFGDILNSGKWNGTADELLEVIKRRALNAPPNLPIREAVDYIYAEIYTTIKAMKFSQLRPLCGGPIEIAVITTDRPFRWVCHKGLSRAIMDVERVEK